MGQIIRHGYAKRRNVDSYARARNRSILLSHSTHCAICGEEPTVGDPLEADHIIPMAQGGSDDLDNLRAVHRSFNRSRGSGGEGVCRRP